MAYDNKYIPKPNSGSLFRNEGATEENNWPSYKGEFAMADGSLMEAAIWRRLTKGGKVYLYLKLGEPREKKQADGGGPASKTIPLDDEDIPF